MLNRADNGDAEAGSVDFSGTFSNTTGEGARFDDDKRRRGEIISNEKRLLFLEVLGAGGGTTSVGGGVDVSKRTGGDGGAEGGGLFCGESAREKSMSREGMLHGEVDRRPSRFGSVLDLCSSAIVLRGEECRLDGEVESDVIILCDVIVGVARVDHVTSNIWQITCLCAQIG